MAAIGGGVAVASMISPRRFLRIFGIAPDEVTGAGAFGWRMFAVRNAYLSGLAWGGNATAREAFLPVQLLDQLVFWSAFKTRSVPRRAAVLAATTSGAIIALDVARRRGA